MSMGLAVTWHRALEGSCGKGGRAEPKPTLGRRPKAGMVRRPEPLWLCLEEVAPSVCISGWLLIFHKFPATSGTLESLLLI